jgi:hypothetical protein
MRRHFFLPSGKWFKIYFMLSPFFLKIQGAILFFLILSTTIALATAPQLPVKRIVIDKAAKTLVLIKDGKQVAEYPATFGIDPDSDKYKAFDCATPEGLYFITDKKVHNRFHRLLGISYPNLENARKGLAEGVLSLMEYKRLYVAIRELKRLPADTGLGGGIAIHGGGVLRPFDTTRERDWTEGCVALNNQAIEEVFSFSRSGIPVIIFNSRRNLYGIIRPFTHAKDNDDNGVPICPDGICTYQIELSTSLGEMVITIKEGKDYGRSLQAMVYKVDDQEKPLLILDDHNADGYLSLLDSITGPIVESTPDAAYGMVREAVIATLSQGNISDSAFTDCSVSQKQ